MQCLTSLQVLKFEIYHRHHYKFTSSQIFKFFYDGGWSNGGGPDGGGPN